MATIYVGPTSAGAANGTSWANRYGTLNAAEDRPVAPSDTVVIGPGTYRESLAVDVAGTAGNPITFVGDEGGTLTDGVGGPVRITGSDNDQTGTRANAIVSDMAYRTWRGLHIDTTTGAGIAITATNNIIEQCAIQSCASAISVTTANQSATVIRRCAVSFISGAAIVFTHTSTLDNQASVVENCVIIASTNISVQSSRVGGITVRNNLIIGSGLAAIRVVAALTVGQVLTANNNIIIANAVGLQATTTAEFVEDYNNLFGNFTARTNVTAGANSLAYTPLLKDALLTLGIVVPFPGQLDAASLLKSITGTGVATDDFYGTTRAATSSWGAVQFESTRRPNDSGQSRGRQQ